MSTRVRLLHNVNPRRRRLFFPGYTDGDPLVLVARYDTDETDVSRILDEVLVQFSTTHASWDLDDDTRLAAAVECRARGNRDFSFGDVVMVGETVYGSTVTWQQRLGPLNVVSGSRRGTVDLDVAHDVEPPGRRTGLANVVEARRALDEAVLDALAGGANPTDVAQAAGPPGTV